MNGRILARYTLAVLLFAGGRMFAQERANPAQSPSPSATLSAALTAPRNSAQPNSKPAASAGHKLGSINVFGSWRVRGEGWDWFQPSSGENSYGFAHSLLRVGIRQSRERFEWLLEGAQDAILGLPASAIAPGQQGQLGLGGTYFAANGNQASNASGFLKQAYIAFKLPAGGKLRLGRFTFLDGAEVTPSDKTLAVLANTRINQRLVGDFGFSAVQRSFDGIQLAFDSKRGGNLTLFGARPTQGVFQVSGMRDLSVDIFYGAYTAPFSYKNGAGELRLFGLGYIDERGSVLKTDNRSLAARAADKAHVRLVTYGADYLHVSRTRSWGQFDFLVWGAIQSGSWGSLTQRAGAFVGETGWQPRIAILKPWFSAGYSYGSGDSNPADTRHATFFQVLPTPRVFARFPFYNMENNEDFYGTAVFRLPRSFVVRSEVHALRLASSQDLWYAGGGPYQPATFGYTGRASGGARSLANVADVSLDVPLPWGFSVTAYYAHAWGKSVIASIYPAGTTAQFGYLETNFHF